MKARIWTLFFLFFLLGPISQTHLYSSDFSKLTEFNFKDNNSRFNEPLGEVSNFKLVISAARTSKIVRSGKGKAEVVKFIAGEGDDLGKYQVNFDFDISIRFIGRKKETQPLMVPAEYFTPKFMEQLRTTGQYQSEEFKVKYLGRENTVTLDRTSYSQCDKIQIYDIKLPEKSPLLQIIREVSKGEFLEIGEQANLRRSEKIKNLTIVALVKEGIPVLGAVKIDLKGTTKGRRIKLGFDFQAQE